MTGTGNQLLSLVSSSDNRIVNGDFLIDQRNEGASVTPASSGYVVDKWRQAQTQASKLSFQKTGVFTGFGNSMTVTVATNATPGAADSFTLQNRIEGLSVADLGFGTVSAKQAMLVFNAQASITGTYSVTLQNSAANRSYPATFSLVAGVPKTIILTIPPDTSGTWLITGNTIGINVLFDLGSGSNFQGTANTWQAGNIVSVSGNAQLVNNAAATYQITNVRLYPGNSFVPYAPRNIAEEFEACRREFQKTFPDGTAPAQSAGIAGAISVKNPIALGDPSEWLQFIPKMIASPTIITYNPSAANANWRDITAGADATVSVDPASTKGASGVLIATSGTVTTLGDILAIHVTADAGL